MVMMPAMVPYLLHVGPWTYQEAQLLWKEAMRVVDRVEMVPAGRRVSTDFHPFHTTHRETGQDRAYGAHRPRNDVFRKWLERQLYPHLGQQVDAYV